MFARRFGGRLLFAELGLERRTLVTINQIPPIVKNAFIATEDKRFYQHGGIDWVRVPGAASFQDSTEVAAQQVVSGQKKAQDALNGLASQWDALNKRKGKDAQLKAYKASLNAKVTSG